MRHRQIAERLSRVDACAISDALDSVGLNGSVSGIPRRSTQARVAGRVQTLRLADTAAAGSRIHLGAASITRASAGDVIVVQQSTGIDAAAWGGILANAAQTKGIAGVIVEGPARDIDECEAIGFPVFSRSTTARTARGRIHEAEINGIIRVGDLEVAAGDYVIADASGVVFIPAEAADRVLDAAEWITRREKAMTTDILGGRKVDEVLGTDYEEMLRRRP